MCNRTFIGTNTGCVLVPLQVQSQGVQNTGCEEHVVVHLQVQLQYNYGVKFTLTWYVVHLQGCSTRTWRVVHLEGGVCSLYKLCIVNLQGVQYTYRVCTTSKGCVVFKACSILTGTLDCRPPEGGRCLVSSHYFLLKNYHFSICSRSFQKVQTHNKPFSFNCSALSRGYQRQVCQPDFMCIHRIISTELLQKLLVLKQTDYFTVSGDSKQIKNVDRQSSTLLQDWQF